MASFQIEKCSDNNELDYELRLEDTVDGIHVVSRPYYFIAKMIDEKEPYAIKEEYLANFKHSAELFFQVQVLNKKIDKLLSQLPEKNISISREYMKEMEERHHHVEEVIKTVFMEYISAETYNPEYKVTFNTSDYVRRIFFGASLPEGIKYTNTGVQSTVDNYAKAVTICLEKKLETLNSIVNVLEIDPHEDKRKLIMLLMEIEVNLIDEYAMTVDAYKFSQEKRNEMLNKSFSEQMLILREKEKKESKRVVKENDKKEFEVKIKEHGERVKQKEIEAKKALETARAKEEEEKVKVAAVALEKSKKIKVAFNLDTHDFKLIYFLFSFEIMHALSSYMHLLIAGNGIDNPTVFGRRFVLDADEDPAVSKLYHQINEALANFDKLQEKCIFSNANVLANKPGLRAMASILLENEKLPAQKEDGSYEEKSIVISLDQMIHKASELALELNQAQSMPFMFRSGPTQRFQLRIAQDLSLIFSDDEIL